MGLCFGPPYRVQPFGATMSALSQYPPVAVFSSDVSKQLQPTDNRSTPLRSGLRLCSFA